MTITEKTSYLKGLLDGMSIDKSTNEGKLLAALVDVVNDISLELADLEMQAETIHEELDAIEEAMDQYEVAFDDIDESLEELYEITDDCFEYSEDCDDHCHCGDDEDDDCDCEDCNEVFYELVCPTCDEKIVLDEDMLAQGGMKCPACGEELEFDFSALLDEACEESDED